MMRQGELIEDLKADFYHRTESIIGGVRGTAYPVEAVTINSGSVHTSGDLRGSNSIPTVAIGVWGMLYGIAATVGGVLEIDSANADPDEYSSRVDFPGTASAYSGLVMTRLGTGAHAGKIKIKAFGSDFSDVYFWPVGWWK